MAKTQRIGNFIFGVIYVYMCAYYIVFSESRGIGQKYFWENGAC